MIVQNSGNPNSPIWVIVYEPFLSDETAGTVYSGGHGYTFRKVWEMAGLPEPYIYVLRPCLGASYDDAIKFSELAIRLSDNNIPFILPTSPALFKMFCPDLVSKSQEKAILKKYSGNLLISDFLHYPHYIIPQYPPDFVGAVWDYHEIQAYIDYGHVKEEYDYFRLYQSIKPLPARTLVTEPTFDQLMQYLRKLRSTTFISTDIETIRPKKDTYYHKLKHPGYPYCVALAGSPWEAISFSYWDYLPHELVQIWRELDYLMTNVPQIGQNYYTFDTHYTEALGFKHCLDKCQDTLIRHHILWPALPHTLQFQTKQYTREPFYKDEGKQWTPKHKKSFMVYNAKDVCVTYEIFEAQEREFAERPQLI